MEKAWLASQLDAGRSFEAIGRDVGKDPSTVAYWAAKHGLTSSHAAKHAARGGIAREELETLVAEGLTTRAIADRVDRSQATVRHWLREYGLRTVGRTRAPGADAESVTRTCPIHGSTEFTRAGRHDHFRCRLCRNERVKARRRTVKATLVADAGGACVVCGYQRCVAALHFHHLDRSAKEFGLALRGSARSLARARAEAAKCILLCANCHAEVEAGIAKVPMPLARD